MPETSSAPRRATRRSRRTPWAAAALLALTLTGPTATADAHGGRAYSAKVLNGDPLSYWRLGESAGPVAIDQTGARPGTYSGGTLGLAGALRRDDNTSLGLDGKTTKPEGEHVEMGDAYDFAGRAPFTLEAWINPHSLNGVTRRVFSKEDQNGGYLVGVRSTGLYFSRYENGVWSTAHAKLRPGVWSHVAATYDGKRMRLYVNGCRRAKLKSTIALRDQAEPFAIGGKYGSWRFFAGGIDEAAVYGRAISPGRVAGHAKAGRRGR
jgi:hypothetical protein